MQRENHRNQIHISHLRKLKKQAKLIKRFELRVSVTEQEDTTDLLLQVKMKSDVMLHQSVQNLKSIKLY